MNKTTKIINRVIVAIIWAVTLFVIAMSLLGCSTSKKASKKTSESTETNTRKSTVVDMDSVGYSSSYTIITDTVDVVVVKRIVEYDTDKAERDEDGKWVAPVQRVIDESMQYGRGKSVVEKVEEEDVLSVDTTDTVAVDSVSVVKTFEKTESKTSSNSIYSMITFLLIGFAAGVVLTSFVGNKLNFWKFVS